MAGVAIITAGTAHERGKLNVNTISVLSKQHGFGTVLPPLRFNQPPKIFITKTIDKKLGNAVAWFADFLAAKSAI